MVVACPGEMKISSFFQGQNRQDVEAGEYSFQIDKWMNIFKAEKKLSTFGNPV